MFSLSSNSTCDALWNDRMIFRNRFENINLSKYYTLPTSQSADLFSLRRFRNRGYISRVRNAEMNSRARNQGLYKQNYNIPGSGGHDRISVANSFREAVQNCSPLNAHSNCISQDYAECMIY